MDFLAVFTTADESRVEEAYCYFQRESDVMLKCVVYQKVGITEGGRLITNFLTDHKQLSLLEYKKIKQADAFYPHLT